MGVTVSSFRLPFLFNSSGTFLDNSSLVECAHTYSNGHLSDGSVTGYGWGNCSSMPGSSLGMPNVGNWSQGASGWEHFCVPHPESKDCKSIPHWIQQADSWPSKGLFIIPYSNEEGDAFQKVYSSIEGWAKSRNETASYTRADAGDMLSRLMISSFQQ